MRFDGGARDDGFTLVELLLVMAVGGIIIALLGSLFVWGYRHASRTSQTFDMNTAGYTAIREITGGIHYDGARLVGLTGAYSVSFHQDTRTLEYGVGSNESASTIAYQLTTDGTLKRTIGNNPAVTVLDNVTTFHVCVADSLLEITLKQADNRVPQSTADAKTKVHPRNAPAASVLVDSCDR